MSGSDCSGARRFNENSPRPPVPGEETEGDVGRYRPESPVLTPRRSSLASKSAQDFSDASAPLGFEPEGSCGTTTMESRNQPACLRWAKNVHCLLEDTEGCRLYMEYLDQESELVAQPLYFWYACEGLKDAEDAETVEYFIKAIRKRFFVRLQLPLDKDFRQDAFRRVLDGSTDPNVFIAAQAEIEELMAQTTYPNFIQSDVYLNYVQACQNPDFGGCPSSESSREVSLSCGPTPLPTLHEDSEFVVSSHNSRSANDTPGEMRTDLRLTKDVLRATQKSRAFDIRREPEAYAGYYLQPGTSPYQMSSKLHAQYSSYNPVSRQDSEVQSISSSTRTGSNLSLTDSSVDGMSIGKSRSSRKHHTRRPRAIPDSAIIHPDPMPEQLVIPRTQRISRDGQHPQPPVDFAKLLMTKLENVQRERDEDEKVKRKLQQDDSAALRDAFSARGFLFEDDNGQAILDEHVSRVWSDPTPSRSPEFASPRPHTPDYRQQTGPHNYMRPLKQRKDNHVVSTFSVDSGNIQDFTEGSERFGASSISSIGSHIPKSKSVPSDHADSLYSQDLYLQGHDQRLRRMDALHRSAKKSMTELTDSGVSVVSYDPSTVCSKDSRLNMRHGQCEKKVDLKHMSSSSRHVKCTRSGSLERTSREKSGIHIHPFVADPGMPPLPGPEPAMVIDEAKRRLEEEEKARAVSKQRHATVSKHMYEPMLQNQGCMPKIGMQSNQSTLRKRQDSGDFTTAVFNFCDEPLAYRTKIPGRSVTLKQFKEYLPKKGSYRFFFKVDCDDVDMKVIQEEITNDAKILPLWEGKVMARVTALE